MKRIVPIIALLLLVFTAAPVLCQEAQFAGIVTKLYDSIEKSDSTTYLSLLVPETSSKIREKPENGGNLGSIYEILQMSSEKGMKITFTDRKITMKEEKGDSAVVEFSAKCTISLSSGESDRMKTVDTISFVKIKGKWYVKDIVSLTTQI